MSVTKKSALLAQAPVLSLSKYLACAYNIYQGQKWYFCYHIVQYSYSNQLLTQSKVLNKTGLPFLFIFFK
jgi:hypothetical protein